MERENAVNSKSNKLFWNGRNNAVIGQALPDVKISAVIPECRNRGSSTHLPFRNLATNDKRGRFPLTACGNDANLIGRFRSGFTLIELLVVVLIIGVLAAVAVPQYQRAVEKSKATQAMTMLKSLGQAQMAYYMANGTMAEKFEELDVDLPFTGKTKGRDSDRYTDALSNEDWSFQLSPSFKLLSATRMSGKYQGTGFFFYVSNNRLGGKLRCVEVANNAKNYCEKLFGAKLGYEGQGLREYDMQ